MNRVLIIGAGGVGRVVAHQCARLSGVFSGVLLASRRVSKCDAIAGDLARRVETAEVDADRREEVEELIRGFCPEVLINVASPYQNLTIMEACVRTGVHYVDTSMDDLRETVKYDYGAQRAFHDRFSRAGLTGLLSMGFDPGVVNVYCAYARKHLYDQIDTIDIIDCNDGDHGLPFATNFDPETNLREVLAPARYFEAGRWKTADALTVHRSFDFPEIGERRAYLMSHEEVLSITEWIRGVRTVRFWMAFSASYLDHVEVLRALGVTGIDPVEHDGVEVIPLRFLKRLLPDPASLAPRTKGKTCIGVILDGIQRGVRRRGMIYNVCVHERCYAEARSQAVSYTTGIPAVLAARLILSGPWRRAGIFHAEQLDPDPFMEAIGPMGLAWRIKALD